MSEHVGDRAVRCREQGMLAVSRNPEWDRLVALVRANLRDASPRLPLDTSTRLPELGLDSFATVNLIMAIEQEFQVMFPDEALTLDSFETLGSVWELVSRLRPPHQPR